MHFRPLFIGLKDHREPIIRARMLVLVVLFAFLAPAIPIDDDSSEDGVIYASDSWERISAAAAFISTSNLAAPLFGITGKTQIAEYLNSHIGEKRFADRAPALPLLALILVFLTALCAVPSLFLFPPLCMEFSVA